MTISNTSEPIEIICSTQKRKRWSALEKHTIVQETHLPGATVSYIARKHGIPPSQLFYWRKVMESGAMTGIKNEEDVVPISEVNELKKRIKQLERVLGQKTMDIEILTFPQRLVHYLVEVDHYAASFANTEGGM